MTTEHEMVESDLQILESMFQEPRAMQTKITRDMINSASSFGTADAIQANSFFNDMVNGVYINATKFVDRKLSKEQQAAIKAAKTQEDKDKLRAEYDRTNPYVAMLRKKVKEGIDQSKQASHEILLTSMLNKNPTLSKTLDAIKIRDDAALKQVLVEEMLNKAIKDAKITSRADKVKDALRNSLLIHDIKTISSATFTEKLTKSLSKKVRFSIKTLSNTISTDNLQSISQQISTNSDTSTPARKNRAEPLLTNIKKAAKAANNLTTYISSGLRLRRSNDKGMTR